MDAGSRHCLLDRQHPEGEAVTLTMSAQAKELEVELAEAADVCRVACLARDFLVSAAYSGPDRKPDRSELSRHHCIRPGWALLENHFLLILASLVP